MFKGNNEFSKEGSYEVKITTESHEVSGGTGGKNKTLEPESMSSVRRKYLKGKGKKIDYGVVMQHKLGGSGDRSSSEKGGEVFSFKKETIIKKGGSGGGANGEEITIKKISRSGSGGREATSAGKFSRLRLNNQESKNESGGKSKKVISTTQIEVTNESQSSGLRGRKTSNDSSPNQKGGKFSRFTKTTETTTTTTTNARGGNNKNDNLRGKKEITTTTTTTKTTSTSQGLRSGNREVVRSTNNIKNDGSSGRRSQTREQFSTKSMTSINQKNRPSQGSQRSITSTTNQRNQPNQPGQGSRTQVTTTKTTTTNRGGQDNSGHRSYTRGEVTTKTTTTKTSTQPGSRKQLVTSQSNSVVTKNARNTNDRNAPNKLAPTSKRPLINQKSTPTLRANNPIQKINERQNRNLKDDKKRPLSTIPQSPDRDNISSVSIVDTGKHPPKTYVLNVRKTDVIQQTKKPRKENKPVDSNYNHNIKVVKNVTKELPTVEDLPKDAKI